jgi:hypothetical protein
MRRSHGFTKEDIGCVFEGARGVYIGEAVQQMARRFGWHGEAVPVDSEWYDEVTQEAEDLLNTLADDDVAFGPSEQGDWGLWHICEDDMDCAFCASS